MPYLEDSDDELQERQPFRLSHGGNTSTSFKPVRTRTTPIESEDRDELGIYSDATPSTPESREDTIRVLAQELHYGTLVQNDRDDCLGTESLEETMSGTESTIPLQNLGQSKHVTPLPLRQLIVPKSQYAGYIPPLPESTERDAVQDLLKVLHAENADGISGASSDTHGEFDEIELHDFVIYLPPIMHHHKLELRGMQYLTLASHPYFLFDGILSVAGEKRYVKSIPFRTCSIGNYGIEHHEVGDDIWIQSDLNGGTYIYYKLTSTPSEEYARFHEGFIWLANLAKHVVDFCQSFDSPVFIHNFQVDFSVWLRNMHQESAAFRSWYDAYQGDDFRPAIARNTHFLYKEAVGVDWQLRKLPLWSEIMDLDYIKPYPQKETKTIVTSFVYDCFSHLQFGSFLKVVEPKPDVETKQARIGEALHLTGGEATDHGRSFEHGQIHVGVDPFESSLQTQSAASVLHRIACIKEGDVIAVTKDTGGVWKDEGSRWKTVDDCWYFLVREINQDTNDEKEFHGIWLYRASDTACGMMKYPFVNELFLSDNCTCGQHGILESEILDVVTVDWHGQPATKSDHFFVRQTYLENERFVTLRDEHKYCEHVRVKEVPASSINASKYAIGQTVLAPPLRHQGSSNELEVYEILRYEKNPASSGTIVYMRRFERRSTYDDTVAANELMYTQIVDKMAATRIDSPCSVRCFDGEEPIPAPYSRGGAGNFFFITTERVLEENGTARLKPLARQPDGLLQCFDPALKPPKSKLIGMDLYCGGGNFGRGLEEGGAIENMYAVDLEKVAIHTYHSNLPKDSKTKLFLGSVDDLLVAAMRGNPTKDDRVPLPGDVDFISAGSPCQGFSKLNLDQNNDKSLKNQSLVASVAAYVDFYRPKYGILENVISMAQRGKGREEDVLSQLICALVGMGYQTHLILLDAWSSGSPQSRSRLFVSFAAPGLEPLEHPVLSHSHPPHVKSRGLGRLANGEAFGSRIHTRTPFKYVTAKECFRDLPFLGDGMTAHCTSHPDHVLENFATEATRRQIQAIPMFPRGSNFASTWKKGQGRMSEADRSLFPPNLGRKGKPSLRVSAASRAWERLNPDRLMGTVTVTLQLASARGAPSIHWQEDRCLTLLEFKRAQSFPDNDVLVGNRAQCMKLIGNSVARTVAVSLGVKLREAWLKDTTSSVMALTNTSTLSKNHASKKTDLPTRPPPSSKSAISTKFLHSSSVLKKEIVPLVPNAVLGTTASSSHLSSTNQFEKTLRGESSTLLSLSARQKTCDTSSATNTSTVAEAGINKLKRRSELMQDPRTICEKLAKSPKLAPVATPDGSAQRVLTPGSGSRTTTIAISNYHNTHSVLNPTASSSTSNGNHSSAPTCSSNQKSHSIGIQNMRPLSNHVHSQHNPSLPHPTQNEKAFSATTSTGRSASKLSSQRPTLQNNKRLSNEGQSLSTSRVKHVTIIDLVSSDEESDMEDLVAAKPSFAASGDRTITTSNLGSNSLHRLQATHTSRDGKHNF